MMGDAIWLCLFKADFSDKKTVRGNLKIKMRIQDFEEVTLDKNDTKKMAFVYKAVGAESWTLVKGSLYFDN